MAPKIVQSLGMMLAKNPLVYRLMMRYVDKQIKNNAPAFVQKQLERVDKVFEQMPMIMKASDEQLREAAESEEQYQTFKNHRDKLRSDIEGRVGEVLDKELFSVFPQLKPYRAYFENRILNLIRNTS